MKGRERGKKEERKHVIFLWWKLIVPWNDVESFFPFSIQEIFFSFHFTTAGRWMKYCCETDDSSTLLFHKTAINQENISRNISLKSFFYWILIKSFALHSPPRGRLAVTSNFLQRLSSLTAKLCRWTFNFLFWATRAIEFRNSSWNHRKSSHFSRNFSTQETTSGDIPLEHRHRVTLNISN